MYPQINFLAMAGGTLWENLVEWYHGSWLHAFWIYLADEVFRVEFGVYENFTLGADSAGKAKQLIIGFLFGAVLAAVCMSYTKLVDGRLIRALLRRGCHSPETAITLREAGVFRDPSIRRDLLRGGALSKLTRCVEAEQAAAVEPSEPTASDAPQAVDPAAPEAAENGAQTAENASTGANNAHTGAQKPLAPDLLTARFYIPEELKYRAEFRYDRKGSGLPQFLLTVSISVVAAVLLCRCIPALLAAADWLMSVLAP